MKSRALLPMCCAAHMFQTLLLESALGVNYESRTNMDINFIVRSHIEPQIDFPFFVGHLQIVPLSRNGPHQYMLWKEHASGSMLTPAVLPGLIQMPAPKLGSWGGGSNQWSSQWSIKPLSPEPELRLYLDQKAHEGVGLSLQDIHNLGTQK